jgi:pyruvate,water dikinase
MKLVSEPLAALSDEQLFAHLELCIATHAESLRLHGYFSIPAILPIADFIAHVTEWTSSAPHDVLGALAASSPASAGDEPARRALIELLRKDAEARATLHSDADPAVIADALGRLPGESGAIARAYLHSAGYRVLNSYDVLDQYALEAPFVIVEGLRVLVERHTPELALRAQASRTALRDAVPDQHRAEFDALFEEAVCISPLRDERVLYNDPWSAGLMRRALLEIGRRLVARRLLDKPEHATVCDRGELRSMLLEGSTRAGSSAGERWLRYRTATCADVPEILGAPPTAPPPTEWFPRSLRRGQRATLAGLAAVFGDAETRSSDTAVTGFGVSPGTYQGVARVIVSPDDFHRIRPGDVLVTRCTSPTYNVLLPLLGAVVTDRGGALSHAAIVSREYGIPGVVGCRDATTRIPDGKLVRVDGGLGECRVVL